MTEFEYIPFDGTETDLNEYGEHTGEFRPAYGRPIRYRGNISSPSGQTQMTFYGEDIRYSHTLVMHDPNADINEYGLIRWKGHLYDILSVKQSLNVLSAALRRQTENHGQPYIPDPEEPDDEEENQDESGSEEE